MRPEFPADALIISGLLLLIAGVMLKFGLRLPGDIVIRRENFTLYLPLATMLLVSIVLSLVLRFLNK